MNFNIPITNKKRIVIIGGGFGGLELANKLKKSNFQIVLIDKNNYHQFPPLLYQVTSAGLESNEISFPYRKLFQKRKDFYFRLAEVSAIVAENNYIETSIGRLSYDYLVIASGTTTNFYGNENIMKYSMPMKTIEEGLALRNRILTNLEKAITSTDADERQSLLNIVVVGGGATGVELSGAISEMKRFIIPKDYPDLGSDKMNIYLLEGTSKLLGNMSEKASEYAAKTLDEMGVTIRCDSLVTDYKDGKVYLDNGNTIDTRTLIWVSGVTATRFENIGKEQTGRGGRIIVNEFNQIKGFSNIYAIGDVCLLTEEKFPNGHPQVAQVAIQQGNLLAKNFKRMESGKPLEPFHYKDLGTLATIGRNKAVADLHRIKLKGISAWLVWLLVHLRSILGVKNKLFVLINWIWNYITYDQSMRFILYVPKTSKNEKENLSQ